MPARFFFDLVSDLEVLRDEEGACADDLETAIAEAADEIREMQRSGELGEDAHAWRLVVRDENGTELRSVSL